MLIACTLMLCTFSLFAQTSKTTVKETIVFDKTVYDYGTITQGADGNCEFKFTNKGKEPLILSNVTSSCGCTVPQWPKEPIAPGKSGSIKVKYDTNRIGMINKTITVNANAINANIVLTIKGTVTAKK